jgi:hypothetical protein
MCVQAAAGYASGGSIDKNTIATDQSISLFLPVGLDSFIEAITNALSKAKSTAPVVLSELEARKKRLKTSRNIGSKR